MRNLNFIGLTFVVLILASGVSGAENRMAVVKVVEPSGGAEAIPLAVESEVPVAGVQMVLGYDPAALTLGEPRLTDRASGMALAFNDRGGEMIVLLYSLEGNTIPAGSGPIISMPITAKSEEPRAENALRFEEVILASSGCQAIPVKVEPIVMKTVPLPTEFALAQNYPNPFNPTTSIQYSVISDQSPPHVSLKIFNLLGQEVKTLVDETTEAGYYTVTWDGRDERGEEVSSGIYFYRLTAGRFAATKRMVLMR